LPVLPSAVKWAAAVVQLKLSFMKSLVKKKKQEKQQTAQCCAKQSRIVAGCHD
jgi:hypothetical protein